MDRSTLRTQLKSLIRRNFDDIDTILNQCIDMAVELMGRNISSIYDEEEWYHAISAGDISGKINNWKLPASYKKILWVTLTDTVPSDDLVYPLPLISPHDQYNARSAGRITVDYGINNPTWGDSGGQGYGRLEYQARPCHAWVLNKNLYVYPYPSSDEENWNITAGLQVIPATLVNDGDTNTISDNYPQALIFLAGTLFWGLHANDPFRFQTWVQLATTSLTGVAKEQELAKLTNIAAGMKN